MIQWRRYSLNTPLTAPSWTNMEVQEKQVLTLVMKRSILMSQNRHKIADYISSSSVKCETFVKIVWLIFTGIILLEDQIQKAGILFFFSKQSLLYSGGYIYKCPSLLSSHCLACGPRLLLPLSCSHVSSWPPPRSAAASSPGPPSSGFHCVLAPGPSAPPRPGRTCACVGVT